MLPPESLTVADLTFKSLIHFKLIFVSGVREKSSFILLITPLFLILCSDFLLATLLKKGGDAVFILSHSKCDSYQQLFEFKKAIFIHH